MRRTVIPRAVILLAAMTAAAGCSVTSPSSPSSAPQAARPTGRATAGSAVAAAERRVRCGAQQQPPVTPLPAGFMAEAAVLCPLTLAPVHGQRHVGYHKQEATRGLGPLLAALRRRVPPPTPGTVCPAQAIPVTWLFLIGRDGQIIRPVIPDDACGQPQLQVLHALRHVPWVTVSAAG
jgi:hypothetical protein